jgi:hypothetical protein
VPDLPASGGLRAVHEGPRPFDPENYGRESYFCESYRWFFDYAMPRFLQVAAQIRVGALVRPPQLT